MSLYIREKLFEIAKDLEPVGQARVAACLCRRNKIYSLGINSRESSKLSRRFSKDDKALCVHAEVDCILNYLKSYGNKDISKCTLYIVRAKIGDSGEWQYGCSYPCNGCLKAIEHFGIKKIVYT